MIDVLMNIADGKWTAAIPILGVSVTGADPIAAEKSLRGLAPALASPWNISYGPGAADAYLTWLDNRGIE